MSNQNLYSIGEFSRLTKLSPDTLRFYEKKGLLHAKRDAQNLRRYNDDDVEHIALVLRLKNADFSLDEILGYTTIRDQGATTIPERLRLMQVKIDQLQQKQLAITASIDYLHDKMAFLNQQSDHTDHH